MGISTRALFLSSVLVGLVAGMPVWAIAKGQWCGVNVSRHRVPLTVQAVTVAGVATTPPAGATYDLTSIAPMRVSGHLHCPSCTGQVAFLDLERKP